MAEHEQQREDGVRWDPVFIHSRREAAIIFCIWLAALLWAVPFCYLRGYGLADDGQVSTLGGIPSWACWGIAAPWLAANVFTVWFCLCVMKDDPLGDDAVVRPEPQT